MLTALGVRVQVIGTAVPWPRADRVVVSDHTGRLGRVPGTDPLSDRRRVSRRGRGAADVHRSGGRAGPRRRGEPTAGAVAGSRRRSLKLSIVQAGRPHSSGLSCTFTTPSAFSW